MQKWEYHVQFMWANASTGEGKEYMKRNFPSWSNPPKFAPQSMGSSLDKLGANGWELVHMEPVRHVGNNNDILYEFGGNFTSKDWSNVYFCVLKRPIQE